jgi:hypothetical protein
MQALLKPKHITRAAQLLIKPILLKFVIEINYLKISSKYLKVKKHLSAVLLKVL